MLSGKRSRPDESPNSQGFKHSKRSVFKSMLDESQDDDDHASSHLLSSSARRSSYHLEESIIVAEGDKLRYKLELQAEMEKSVRLSGRVAALEAENEGLRKEAVMAAADFGKKEQTLRDAMDKLDKERRTAVFQAANKQNEDAKPSAAEPVEQASDSLEAVAAAKKEAAEATKELVAAKDRILELEKRYEEARQATRLYWDSGISSDASAQSSGSDEAQKIKDLGFLVSSLTVELKKAKMEEGEMAGLRKEAKRLRGIEQSENDVKSRNKHLESMVQNMVHSEAQLRQERDSLLDWKVALAVGMSNEATPAEIIEAFVSLRNQNLKLETKVASLQERVNSLLSKHEETSKLVKVKETTASELEAKLEALTKLLPTIRALLLFRSFGCILPAVPILLNEWLAWSRELTVEKAKVGRAEGEVQDLLRMTGSFKAEEVLVKDLAVVDLSKKANQLKQKLEEKTIATDAQIQKKTIEIEEAKRRINQLEGQLEREKQSRGNALETMQKERAKAKSDIDMLNETIKQLKEKINSEKEQNKKDKDIALQIQRKLNQEIDQQKSAAKAAAIEIEKALKTAKSEAEKAQGEAKASKEKEEKEKAEKIKAIKIGRAKIDELQLHQRLAPALFGYVVSVQKSAIPKATEKKEKEERQMLITVKPKFAEESGQATFIIKATIPVSENEVPNLELQDGNFSASSKEKKEKYIDGASVTKAKPAAVSSFLGSMLLEEFDRLVEQKEVASLPKADEGQVHNT